MVSEVGKLRDRLSGTLEPGEGDQGWHLNSPGKASGEGYIRNPMEVMRDALLSSQGMSGW